MKITKSQLIQLIKEETQGEMEFAELEAARQNYKENFRDDEARHQFGLMVEKLVEPLMIDMGLFFEAEAFYNRGEIVFNNDRVEVTIDPLGMMGRYDVMVTPQYGAEDDIKPVEISLDTMKGVAQFVNDEVFRSSGMVGEPEAQTELPLEHKMRITKTKLQKIIKEEIKKVLNEDNFDMVMRKALSVLGSDIMLNQSMDGEIFIEADDDLIEANIGELNEVFPDGSWSDEGFYTGFME
jgi:hypothetical protein